MKVDIRITNEFYKTYSPCNCGNCRYFIKNIETMQPDICDYLKLFGVNPLKPYELMSIYHEKEKKIEYLDCAYIVFGEMVEETTKEINGIKISICSKEKYPFGNIEEDHFFITFGPINMKCEYVYNRHFSFNEKVDIINRAINEVDPMGLIAINCPKDEYMQEAILIAEEVKIKKNNFVKGKLIQNVLKKQFDEVISLRVCNNIARQINTYLDIQDYYKDFEENELLKGKVTINDCEIILKIHDGFIVKTKGYKTYVNDKFYYNIEEPDLLDSFCEFVEDDDVIYIQYINRRLGFHFNHSGYFKKIHRSKYSFRKLKHKKNIELIFDNKKILYSNKQCNLPKNTVVEIMPNEPVKNHYEKIFYSPDKKKRLIVIKNNMGSYSYYFEKLTLLDDEEAVWYGCHTLWEPEFGIKSVSFYENIELLLRDINVEIKDWTEVNDF